MRIWKLLSIAALSCPATALAAPQPDPALHVARDWFTRDPKLGCIDPNADPIPCKITADTKFQVFRSKDRMNMLVIVTYLPDATGNAEANAAAVVQESPQTGGWSIAKSTYGIAGQEPGDVKFAPERVSFAMKVMRGNDSRCCPTGLKTFFLPLR